MNPLPPRPFARRDRYTIAYSGHKAFTARECGTEVEIAVDRHAVRLPFRELIDSLRLIAPPGAFRDPEGDETFDLLLELYAEQSKLGASDEALATTRDRIERHIKKETA